MFPALNRRILQGLGWADPVNLEELDSDVGIVTNPTGTVNGKDLSKLLDCYAGNFGGILDPVGTSRAQWQHAVVLSAVADPCAREGSGGAYAASELTLQFAFVGYADLPSSAPVYPPAADLPLLMPGTGGWVTTSEGEHRQVIPSVMTATKGGKASNQTNATGGTVAVTRWDAGGVEGSYDLPFGSGGTAAGLFAAPWCGTAP